jgi:hypothetical protein
VLVPGHKFKAVDDDMFHIMLWNEDRFSSRKIVSKDEMKAIKNFRIMFEDLIDEMLALQLTMAPISSSMSMNLPSFDAYLTQRRMNIK